MSGRLPGADTRLLRGYGPLVVRIAAFTLMVTLVPTVARERLLIRTAADGSGPTSGSGAGPAAGGPGATSAAGANPAAGNGGPASAASAGSKPLLGKGSRTSAAATSATGAQGDSAATGPCADRVEQIAGDPYSPPCVAFSGDNGGATSRGVTNKEILVALRVTGDPSGDYQSLITQMSGGQVTETADDIRRTGVALVDYFNQSFQLYGRRIKIVEYQGRGTLAREILGGGQEEANADAIKVAGELGAFADLSAFTQPYADALARQKVMAFGAPYMSREWFAARRPYAWSLAPDCSRLSEASAEFAVKRILGRPAAHAGGDLKGRPRKVAIIAPDNPEYQQCVDAGVKRIRQGGKDLALRLAYSLDLSNLSNQAASLVARLKSEQITSVACACDPLLPVYLTAKAHEQGYVPEWLVTGTALTDLDIVGQLYDREEWSHAFGASALGDQPPRRAGLGYHAYKSVRADEPSQAVELMYFQLYMLTMGLQMAGPHLTPETFEQGMFAYPRRCRRGRRVELRPRPLHAPGRGPGDLLGPGQDLALQRQEGRLRDLLPVVAPG
jgi:hypothetical protein